MAPPHFPVWNFARRKLISYFFNILFICFSMYNNRVWLSWYWGRWKGHRTWVRIPGPPMYFMLFLLIWSGVYTGVKTTMCPQGSIIRSPGGQIWRPLHEGPSCIPVKVQHGILEVNMGQIFGPKSLLLAPPNYCLPGPFSFSFYFYIFFI